MMAHGDTDRKTDPRILELCRSLGNLRNHKSLFPKTCKTCSQQFLDLSEYVVKTLPKAHVFEDCSETMGKPFTMMYRHCSCGNTLVTTLTDEIFEELEELWKTLRQIAKESGRPLNNVVNDFCKECDEYLGSLK